MYKLISYSEARSSGLKRYFTGMTCKHGHIAERFSSNGTCVQCHNDWIINNKEKFLKTQQRSQNKRADKLNAKRRQWYDNNREKARAYVLRWRQNNPNWNDREASRKRTLEWVKNNKERHNLNCRVRKARKRSAQGKFTSSDALRILKTQNGKCACCRVKLNKKYHIDHIIPLVKCGTNWPNNLQILCVPCNLSKSSRDPIEFMQERGFLL